MKITSQSTMRTKKEIVASNIKHYREMNNIEPLKLANVLGVDETVYTSYESAQEDIPFNQLQLLSDYFGVDLTNFFEPDTTKLEQALVCVYRTDAITENDVKTIIDFNSIVKKYIKIQRLASTGI